MSSILIRENGEPTEIESRRIKIFIEKQERIISNADKDIEAAQQNICDAIQAIQSLETVIPLAKRSLINHSEAYSALLNAKNVLLTSDHIEISNIEPGLDEKSPTYHDCSKIVQSINTAVTSGLLHIRDQVDMMQNNIREIRFQLHRLEEELKGWQFSLKLSNEEIISLTESQTRAETMIKAAKNVYSPVRRVPGEVWIEIFQYHVQGEFDLYLLSKSKKPLVPSALRLSLVCREWRQIVDGKPSLWQIVPAHSPSSWSDDKKDILLKMAQAYTGHSTLVMNLASQTFMVRPPTARKGQVAQVTQLLAPETYSLILSLPADGQTWSWLASNIVFRLPISLTIHIMAGEFHEHDLLTLQMFSSTQKLTLIGVQNFNSQTIATHIPRLTYLRLHLTIFTNFDLCPHLPSTLEEFHISHHGINRCSMSTTNVHLSGLVVLGVTPYEIELFKDINLPALRTIILYAPKASPNFSTVACGVNASYFCGRVRNLEFHDWAAASKSNDETEGGNWDAINLFREILKHCPKLRLTKFRRTFIEGNRLIQLLNSLLEEGAAQSQSFELTLDHCEGITQTECEKILFSEPKLVERLNIYV